MLTKEEIIRLSNFAKELDLEVLCECHSLNSLNNIPFESVDFVGVNNRDLHSFDVDIATSKELFAQIPDSKLCISESGISKSDKLKELFNLGYKGFLIGEHFMSQENPGLACSNFISQINCEA